MMECISLRYTTTRTSPLLPPTSCCFALSKAHQRNVDCVLQYIVDQTIGPYAGSLLTHVWNHHGQKFNGRRQVGRAFREIQMKHSSRLWTKNAVYTCICTGFMTENRAME